IRAQPQSTHLWSVCSLVSPLVVRWRHFVLVASCCRAWPLHVRPSGVSWREKSSCVSCVSCLCAPWVGAGIMCALTLVGGWASSFLQVLGSLHAPTHEYASNTTRMCRTDTCGC